MAEEQSNRRPRFRDFAVQFGGLIIGCLFGAVWGEQTGTEFLMVLGIATALWLGLHGLAHRRRVARASGASG